MREVASAVTSLLACLCDGSVLPLMGTYSFAYDERKLSPQPKKSATLREKKMNLLIFVHFVHLFICSFGSFGSFCSFCSFVHLFICSFVHSFIRSFVHFTKKNKIPPLSFWRLISSLLTRAKIGLA